MLGVNLRKPHQPKASRKLRPLGYREMDVRGTEPDQRTFEFPSGFARRYDGAQRSNGPIPFTGFLLLPDGNLRPIWRHFPVVDRAGKIGVIRGGGVVGPGIAPSTLDAWRASRNAVVPTIGDGPGLWADIASLFVLPSMGGAGAAQSQQITDSFSRAVD